MNRIVRAALGGFLLAMAMWASAAESGVSAVDKAWVRAMKAADVPAVVACYSADALFWNAGAPLARGATEIRAAYEGFFRTFTVKDAALVEMGHETVGENSVSWGRFVLSFEPKEGGSPVTTTGRYTVMAKRVGDRWVYTLDHASSDPAAAARESRPSPRSSP